MEQDLEDFVCALMKMKGRLFVDVGGSFWHVRIVLVTILGVEGCQTVRLCFLGIVQVGLVECAGDLLCRIVKVIGDWNIYVFNRRRVL